MSCRHAWCMSSRTSLATGAALMSASRACRARSRRSPARCRLRATDERARDRAHRLQRNRGCHRQRRRVRQGPRLRRLAGARPQAALDWDRTILGKISKRGNRYLRVLFVQAAWVVLIKPKSWERHGLKPWLEAAKKRLHHNVLAIALANKLARIAWSVLAHDRNFETRKVPASAQ